MPFPLDNKSVPPVWVESGGKYKKLYQDSEVQVSLLTGQLQQTQASLAQAQADLAQAQAQIVQDAQTIASLTGQVASLQQQVSSLQAQIAALNNPMYGRFILTRITTTGGGVYIPPSYTNPVVNLRPLLGRALIRQITRTGGGYP